jgi:hypothetical protein
MKDDGLFANVRDDLYLWVDHPDGETRLRRLGLRIMALIGKLANCPFCQTYHVVLALLILWWLARNVFPSPWDDATIYGIYWLALVRVAHRLEGDYNARGS